MRKATLPSFPISNCVMEGGPVLQAHPPCTNTNTMNEGRKERRGWSRRWRCRCKWWRSGVRNNQVDAVRAVAKRGMFAVKRGFEVASKICAYVYVAFKLAFALDQYFWTCCLASRIVVLFASHICGWKFERIATAGTHFRPNVAFEDDKMPLWEWCMYTCCG